MRFLLNHQGPRVIAGLLAFAALATAVADIPKLYIQSTANVEVLYYSPSHEYLVTHLIRSFENALQFQRDLFRYTPSEKVIVLIEDFNDYGHGGAGTIPSNFINIGIAPFSYTYETLPANERMTWVTNHELIHIVMGENASDTDRKFRKIFFGKVGPTAEDPISMFYSSLTNPRHYSTRWFHEGVASFMETWMAGGLGRALGGYDEMVFRSMVRDDAYIYDVVGLEAEGTAIDFQTGANAYLYGTRFLTWLTKTNGTEKLLAWLRRSDGGKRYFSNRFAEVYGVSMAEMWRRWIVDERTWQADNLKRIHENPVTVPERLTEGAVGSVSRAYFDSVNGKIYAAVRYPGKLGHIMEFDPASKKIRNLTNIKGTALYFVTSLAFDPKSRRLFYTTDNNDWRDLNVLELKTKKSQRLLTNIRIGDLAFNVADDSIWAIRHHNGLSSIAVTPAPYKEVRTVHEFPYGDDLFDIDVSPDGCYLTGALTDLSGKQKLVRFETTKLLAGEKSYETLHDFEYNSPGNFVHSQDGRYLYGSSYFTGASNLFRYDTTEKKMDVISNAETGLFRPLPLVDGGLIAFEYTSKGFIPARVPNQPLQDVSSVKYLGMEALKNNPVMRKWKLPPPSRIDESKLMTRSGRYTPIKNIELISAYPIIQGYKNSVAGGYRLEFSDRLRLAGLNLTATVSPDKGLSTPERIHASFDAHVWSWKLKGYYNNADFYDLFGPTKVSRKGYMVQMGHSRSLLYDTPRTLDLEWNVAGYGGMERLPDYQNVAASYSSFFAGNLWLKYSFLQRSQGAVDDERGVQWRVGTRMNYANGTAFPKILATWDRGFLLPLRNSSIWVRTSAGKAYGDRDNSFANFYFGGFGNNWVDHASISRFREFYSFPGVELNEIAASSYARALVEWNLPPVRFRRLGTTWMYCNWVRPTVFSSGLVSNLGNDPLRTGWINLGAQLDFRVVLFTYLNTTFSAGYAGATERRGHISREYMFSLKIL